MEISRRIAFCAGVTATALLSGGAAVWATGATAAVPHVIATAALRIGSSNPTKVLDSAEPPAPPAAPASTDPGADSAPDADDCTDVIAGFPPVGGVFGHGDATFDLPGFVEAFDVPADLPADVIEHLNGEFPHLVVAGEFPPLGDVHVAFNPEDFNPGDFNPGDFNPEDFNPEDFNPGDLPMEMPDFGSFENPQEVKDRMAVENQALLDALTARGIDAELVEGPNGFSHVEWDYADAAANAAVAEFFAGPRCPLQH